MWPIRKQSAALQFHHQYTISIEAKANTGQEQNKASGSERKLTIRDFSGINHQVEIVEFRIEGRERPILVIRILVCADNWSAMLRLKIRLESHFGHTGI